MEVQFFDTLATKWWKLFRFDLAQIDADYADYDEDMSMHSIVFIDLNDVEEVDKDWFFEDLFSDGISRGIDLQQQVPFALIGDGVPENSHVQKGDLDCIAQLIHVLFLDTSKAAQGQAPVLVLDVAGSAIPGSVRQVAASIAELRFE